MDLLKAAQKIIRKKGNDILCMSFTQEQKVHRTEKQYIKSVPFPDTERDISMTEKVVSLQSYLPRKVRCSEKGISSLTHKEKCEKNLYRKTIPKSEA